MNSIEITAEQKEKLLEMCNFLFPEYNFMFHHADEGQPDTSKPWNFLPGFIMAWEKYPDGEYSEYYRDVDIFVHWFEFCMTHLQDTLKGKGAFNLEPDCDIILMSSWYKSHPIDCLYEQFKLLKNENAGNLK